MRPVIVGNVTAGEDVKVAEASRYRGMGMTRDEVAERMGVSPRTVSRYWAKAIAVANA
jgi:DNA-binding transcriptional regulator LsrR (DeoR family)